MAVPRILSIFKVRDEGNLEFWVSNVVIILSTVLGVYLAAQAGYRTALDFELARTRAGELSSCAVRCSMN